MYSSAFHVIQLYFSSRLPLLEVHAGRSTTAKTFSISDPGLSFGLKRSHQSGNSLIVCKCLDIHISGSLLSSGCWRQWDSPGLLNYRHQTGNCELAIAPQAPSQQPSSRHKYQARLSGAQPYKATYERVLIRQPNSIHRTTCRAPQDLPDCTGGLLLRSVPYPPAKLPRLGTSIELQLII